MIINPVILGGPPEANQLAYDILSLCRKRLEVDEGACGYEVIGILSSVKHQLMAEANEKMLKDTEMTNKILGDNP